MFDLLLKCQGSASISFNDHKANYQPIQEHIEELKNMGEEIPIDIIEEMIKRDIIIRVQAYPNTPIGFYLIFHYDVTIAIEQMNQVIKNELDQTPRH